MKYKYVRYVGADPRLVGKSALMNTETALVQFDDTTLPEANGWHEFRLSDFEEVEE